MSFEVSYEEDLLPRIRDLIDGYSKDSILKEYLQNADDSKATELVVTFDRRVHQSLENTRFSGAKDQALLLYNNSKFKEADFKAIVKISAQGKASDAHSTGRFGQGFSSSFSISDHPSFVSNGRAYWFDVLKNSVSKDKDRSIQGWKESDFGEINKWLDTFILNPVDKDFNRTIFRLPLRTESTAENSEISHEIFSYNDFLKWCGEWKDNADSLLFLRHVHKLVLKEIDVNGNEIIHVEIKTKNSDEVEKISNKIQKEFSGELLDICTRWKKDTKELPICKYHHHFLVKFLENGKEKIKEESWAVVNGLFKGEGDSLLEQASKVLKISPNYRKVLPWAGVAIKLDNNKPLKVDNSKLYTFLPLPITSSYPVHIHGWFDLNPKRTEITHDGAGDDKEKLIRWNKLLFQEGVGVAWAYLIDFIKKDCKAQSYYSLWPKNNDDVFDDYLLQGFYNKITELDCLKTQYKENERWSPPSEEIYILQESNKNLFSAYQNHFPIITPKPPPKYIVDGIKLADIDLGIITPEFIREYLEEQSEDIEFPVPLGKAPITMLSKKEWLLPIIEYCTESQEDINHTHLSGLPIQLDIDNNLHIVQENCLLDSNPKLNIFQDGAELFVDSEIVELLKGAENLPDSWRKPILKNYLSILNEHIAEYKFDKKWIKAVIIFILDTTDEEIEEALDEIQQLQIVYQSDEEYGFLESKVGSPVLVSNEEISNISLLAKTGMTLVHSDYIDIYTPLAQLKDVDLITKLSPSSLIKYLVQIPEEEYSFFEDRELREYLVDFITQDTSWFDGLSENELEWLNDMPFIATESGNLFSKNNDKKLFLPAGFKPPENIQSLQGEYELIKVVDDGQRALFQEMGFKEQNPVNYLEEIIIPFVEDSSCPVDDIKSILGWLANEWEQLTSKITDAKKEELVYKLSEARIILDSGSSLNTASNYYHPEFLSTLPPFLKDKKYSPLSFESDNTQHNWKNLLTLLGASQAIIPQHIVDVVESISEKQDYKKSIKLLNYISNHFEWFDDMQYKNKPIFEYLSDLAWIPAEKPKNILRPSDEDKALRKPSEIIQAKDYMIAGGCHYSLSSKVKFGKKDSNGEFSERDMAEKIKLLVRLPVTSVFESFQRLRDIATNDQEKKISDFAKAFYKYIGRTSLSENEIPNDIKEKSIFIMGEWLSSNKVFQSPPAHLSGIFSWDELVTNDGTESQLAKGLIKLGVLDRPDNNYLIDYLHNNIPRNEKLNGQQLKEAKAILNHFQGNLEDLEVNDIPLISRSDQLVDCSSLYIKDLPAYNKSEKKNDQLEFCRQQFEKLAKHCDVVSLADGAIPQLDNEHSQEPGSVDNSWNDYIRSEPFKWAVLRLIFHEGKISDDEIEQDSIDKVLPSEVILMDRLVVNYYINGTWIYDDVETSTYQDTENSILYLLNQDDEEDMCDSIAQFITKSSKLNSYSLLLIARILRNKLSTLKEIQNLLDKQKIKLLPEKIEIDEDISLYGGNTESLNDSTSHNEDIDQDDPSSDDYNQENEQLPPDDDQHSEVNSLQSNETEKSDDEIPPPTKPKQSGSQDDAIDTSSGDHNQNTGNSGHNWGDHNANRGSQNGGGSNWQGGNGSGTRLKSTRNSVSPNNRMPVYVGKEKKLDEERTDEEREFAKEIGGKGEKYVLDHSKEYLFSTSNRFVKAATDNNKGYDITEVDSNGEIVRYIEVKTLTGKWGEGGVGITESQLEFAQVYENWWLFIVENINTVNTKIHVLENPVLQANRFMFDHSWKQLAVEAKEEKDVNPQAGEKYLLPEGVYEILSVDPKGKFFKVKLKHTQSNKEVTKKFDPSWKKC